MSIKPTSSLTPMPQSMQEPSPTSSTSGSRYLDWTQRPESLQCDISSAFDRIVRDTSSSWNLYNGSPGYFICDINDYSLVKKIIQAAKGTRKEFYALDIGAGNYQWSQGLADFIDQQTDLPNDIKLHIIGVRGESYLGNRAIETARCKIYYLGAFKIEELFAEFKKQNLDIENKVDLAVSRWCFRHLADPVGTFQQTYNLLRPETGFFLLDGFFLLHEKEHMEDQDHNVQMTQLLLDTKAPFLTNFFDGTRSLNHFILQRPDTTPCQLPMSYLDEVYIGWGWQNGSEIVTRFKREPQKEDSEGFHLSRNYDEYCGDKKMYEWLRQNRLIERFFNSNVWKPLQDKENYRSFPLLHQAVQEKDVDKVKRYLNDNKCDINESDSTGCTALHIAIQERCYAIFQLLLNRGADFRLANGEKETPFKALILSDSEGQFLQALIDAGVNVNEEIGYKLTPLSCAIQAKNLKAIEILIKAGAKISEENSKSLEDDVFSSLRDQGIIPSTQKERRPEKVYKGGGFKELHGWIKRGDCVVLHYHGSQGIMYHYPSDEKPKLFYLDINPKTHLLDDGEWPDFLELEGYQSQPYDAEQIAKTAFSEVRNFQFGYT
jgi:ankyrin repeat protein